MDPYSELRKFNLFFSRTRAYAYSKKIHENSSVTFYRAAWNAVAV